MALPGALANLDVEATLDRIAAGTLSKVIAAELDVSPYGLRKRLAKHEDYKAAVAEQAQAFVEQAVGEVMSADLTLDAVAIARARVRVDTAFKYARAHNQAYADRQEVTHNLPNGPLFQITVAQVPTIAVQHERLVDDSPDNDE